MIDYCLKNTDEAEFNQLMLDTGLCVEVTQGEGEEAVTSIVPADYTILIDRIGPITMQTGTTKKGVPVISTLNEYHVNLRLLFAPSEELLAALDPFIVDPGETQQRVWA